MAYVKNSGKIDTARQRTHDNVDRLMDKAESIRDTGIEKMDQMKENAMMMKDDVDDYIRRNPERSVLMSAGIGIALGALVTAVIMRRKD